MCVSAVQLTHTNPINLTYVHDALSLYVPGMFVCVSVINCTGTCVSLDVRVEEWPCGNADDSAKSQDREGGDDCESDITFGEMEQRLDLLQEHLNR